ncbi:CG31029, partial [Drosophila busckii]
NKQEYIFDIVMVKSSIARRSEENSPVYSVRLYKDFVDLTYDRLYAEEFPEGQPLGHFVASPCELISQLTHKGICVALYDNNKMLGSATCSFSTGVLRQLTESTFEIIDELPIQLMNRKTAVAQIALKFKITTTDPNLDSRLLPFGCYDICKPADSSVNPRDLIFTLGRSRKCGGTSCITDERLMSHAGAPFKCVHGKTKESNKECSCGVKGAKVPPELDPSKERERKQLKKLLADLKVDEPRVPTPPPGHAASKRHRQRKSSDESVASEDSAQFYSLSSSNSEQAIDLDVGLTPEQMQELQQARKRALGICPDIKPPELLTSKYKPPLLCPVCKANITWLPKVAACPYCGHKHFAMDKPSEEEFDECQTAEQVLRDHFLGDAGSSQRVSKSSGGDGNKKNCECTQNRICTRCRIRQLCQQMFQQSDDNKQKPEQLQTQTAAAKQEPQQQQKEQPAGKPLKKEASSATLRRKKLIKIFDEMAKAYGSKASTAEQLLQNCEAECQQFKRKAKTPRGRRRVACALKQVERELASKYPVKKRKRAAKSHKPKRRSTRYTFLVRSSEVERPRFSHTSCAGDNGRIPCHMGWMWTKSELARYRDWKPGAISKTIRSLMAYFLRDYPLDRIPLSRYHYRKRLISLEPPEEPLVQHPTLHITRRHDEYVITLRPLKDPKTLAVCANPYAEMKPVVFRIVKDPIAAGKRALKLKLMEKGYPVCTCKLPVNDCFCRSVVDKKVMQQEVQGMCLDRGWPNMNDTFVYSDLSEDDSDNEFEFGVTPPAGIIKPERLRHPDRINSETQYEVNDWAMPTMYPHPPNPHVQYAGCVVGERKAKFSWIMGKGNVHAPAKPAKKMNISKKRQKGGQEQLLPAKRIWHKSS